MTTSKRAPRGKTTEALRRAIQASAESTAALARRYRINPKTVAKWRRRKSVRDAPRGPKAPRSTVLSPEEEMIVVYFRRHCLLPLDDCFYVLQAHMPRLTRSSLHRCLQRHGISRFPPMPERRPGKGAPEAQIGQFVVGLPKVYTGQGPLFMCAATDLRSQFTYAEMFEEVTPEAAAHHLQSLIKVAPYRIHTMLTPRDWRFCGLDGGREDTHPYEAACRRADITHRYVADDYPWTKQQIARIDRNIESLEAAKYQFKTPEEAKEYLRLFLVKFNFFQRLKSLRGRTPHQYAARFETTDWPAYFAQCPLNIDPSLTAAIQRAAEAPPTPLA